MESVKTSELEKLFKEKGKITVKVINREVSHLESSYAEDGMIGIVTNIYNAEPGFFEMYIDWETYKEVNIPLETTSFYKSDGSKELITFKETGFYPENGIEGFIVSKDSSSGLIVIE